MNKTNNTHRFELVKESNREFDLSKKTARKFELKKEDVGNSSEPIIPIPEKERKTNWRMITGCIIGLVIMCLLGYGAYYYFNSSDENTDDTNTEIVDGTAKTFDESDNKGQNNDQTEGTPGSESAEVGSLDNGEETESPAQEETSSKAEQKRDVPAKATIQTAKTIQLTTPVSESITTSGSLEEKAKEVIRGNYGNGEDRKQKLGEHYSEIQSKVNEMYRSGLVK